MPTGHQRPPVRVSYGKQSTGLFSYFPALADATKTLGALPPFSAAASGDAAQWAAPITDRRGSGDQALDGAHRAPAPLPAFFRRKLGKELHPPTARTRANCSHRRGVQPPSLGANCPARPRAANCLGCNPRELTAQALGKLYVGSPFSCSVNLRGQPTGCPRFFYAAPSSRAPG